jgi:hypothetical protein
MLRPVVLFFLLALAGCNSLKDYDVTLNERLVYSARPLSVDPAVKDAALAACISQSLKDGEVKAVADLKTLNCSKAGITRLDGIAVYAGITRLGLAGNQISDAAPLNALSGLILLNLEDNPGLNCGTLPERDINKLTLPEHCRA